MLNPNKRSILLDLKNEEDRDIFLELASTADIIIENFAPGVVDRLGVGYETIKKIKPKSFMLPVAATGKMVHTKVTRLWISPFRL